MVGDTLQIVVIFGLAGNRQLAGVGDWRVGGGDS